MTVLTADVVLNSALRYPNTVDITVSSWNEFSYKANIHTHMDELALPSGAVVTRAGTKVAFPELLFL